MHEQPGNPPGILKTEKKENTGHLIIPCLFNLANKGDTAAQCSYGSLSARLSTCSAFQASEWQAFSTVCGDVTEHGWLAAEPSDIKCRLS